MHTSTLSRLPVAAGLLALVFSAVLPATLSADTFTWNSSAAGTWDTTSTSAWSSGVAWNNAGNDTASFGGSAATYTVSIAPAVAISAGGITVSTGNNVTIGGGVGSSFTLAGTTPTIGGAGNTTLDIVLAGSNGLTKSGGGTLRFKQTSTYTGDTALSGGQLTLEANDGVGSTGKLTISGGATFSMQGKNQSLAGLSGVSGTTIRSTSANTTSTLTITGGTNTFAGTLSNSGTNALLSLTNSGGTLALTGTNSYSGATIVSGGTLNLGSSLANTNSVTVSGGTLNSSVSTAVALGTGAFSLTSGALAINGTSIGSFTLATGQNFTASIGTLNFTLGASNTSDQIIGSGAFNLSSLTLALNGTTSVAGSYTLFSGFTGNSVSDITITGLDPGFTGVFGTNGILTVSAIPEPSTFAALFGVAALGVAALRRRETRA
ncbi:beta strand repeat-containing protein [Rariglobus hedericola]|nr:autotransporter-associated beta strand repeat-containing protein [Rariglobus hedericola]